MKSTITKELDAKSKALKEDDGHETDMANSALHELFINELKDIYWAEKYLVKNLPKMAEKATSNELKAGLTSHLLETQGHVTRLEQIFESLGEEASAKKCEAMAGLVDEANETIGETAEGSMVRDVAIIACAQKVEHYEIATYGTLRTLAEIMGHRKAVELLSATLAEEKKADSTLTQIGVGNVNDYAAKEQK